MGYLEVILFLIATVQISRNRMALPITIILFLSQAYCFCGVGRSELGFSHLYSDTSLVLYIFMLIVMFLHKPQKVDMRLVHPVKVGIVLFLVFFVIAAIVDLLVNDVKFSSVVRVFRQWICLSAVWVIPYLKPRDVIKTLNYVMYISVLIAVVYLYEFYTDSDLTGAYRFANGTRASIPWSASFLVFVLLFNNCYRISTFLKWLFIAIIVFEYFMTGTRSIFFACVIVAGLSLLFNGKGVSTNKIMILAFSLAAVGIVLSTDNILTERLFTTKEDISALQGNGRRVGGNMSFRLLMLEERMYYLNQHPQYAVFGIGNIQEIDLKQHLFHIGLKKKKGGGVNQLDTDDIAWALLFLRYGYLGTLLYIGTIFFSMIRLYFYNRKYSLGFGVLLYILCALILLSYTSAVIASSFFWLIPMCVIRLLPSTNFRLALPPKKSKGTLKLQAKS
jgi:hypothetical protein